MIDAISCVMHPCLCCTSAVYPTILLPQTRHVIVVPGLLLPKYAWQTVRRVNSFWVAVMVSEYGKDWTRWQEVLELFKHAEFRVLEVHSG